MKNQILAYRGCKLTEDTTRAIAQVEQATASMGNLKIHLGTTSQLQDSPMWKAGREVAITMTTKDTKQPVPISNVWGLVIPAGFTPWDRYPIEVSPTKNTFHFLGPWQQMMDSLLGEGLGEYAWDSVTTASQIEAKVYSGDRKTEREVQCYLHYLGVPCGPISGVIDNRCITSLQALGIKGLPLDKCLEAISKMNQPTIKKEAQEYGHIVCPRITQAQAYGDVLLTRNQRGYEISIQGSGRVILDIK